MTYLDAGVIGTNVLDDPGTATASGDGVNGSGTATAKDTGGANLVQSPAVSVTKTPDIGDAGQPLSKAVGDTVEFTYVVENTGNVTLENVALTDNLEGTVNLPTATLAPGATTTATKLHVVTQADLDAGVIGTNVLDDPGTATASGDGVNGSGTATAKDTGGANLVQSLAVSVTKTPDIGDAGQPLSKAVGDTVEFTYVVENTGNVTLENVALTDNLEGTVNLPTATLAPGATTTATKLHVVTQADLDAGVIGTNVLDDPGTATASGDGVNGSGTATAKDTGGANLVQSPLIDIVKSLASNADEDASNDVSEGDTLTYSFLVTNTGNVTLNPVVVKEPLSGLVSSPIALGATSLAPNATTTGTATYVVTPANVSAGAVNNTATATGTAPDGSQPSDQDSESVAVVQAVLSVSKIAALTEVFYTVSNTAFASASNAATASDTRSDTVVVTTEITYAITVTNTGDGNAVGVMLTDAVPAGTMFVTASAGCSESGGTVTCTIGGLAANGGSATVTIVVATQ